MRLCLGLLVFFFGLNVMAIGFSCYAIECGGSGVMVLCKAPHYAGS